MDTSNSETTTAVDRPLPRETEPATDGGEPGEELSALHVLILQVERAVNFRTTR